MMTNQTIACDCHAIFINMNKGRFVCRGPPIYTVPITLGSYWSCGFREEGFISIWSIRNLKGTFVEDPSYIIPAIFS